jgi:hypothetical protein
LRVRRLCSVTGARAPCAGWRQVARQPVRVAAGAAPKSPRSEESRNRVYREGRPYWRLHRIQKVHIYIMSNTRYSNGHNRVTKLATSQMPPCFSLGKQPAPSYARYCPPLSENVAPVMKSDSSLARKATIRATSPGFPSLPLGIAAMIAFNTSSRTPATMSVST